MTTTHPPATLEGWDVDFVLDDPKRGKYWDYFKDSFSQSGYTLYIVSPVRTVVLCPASDSSIATMVMHPRIWLAQKNAKVYWIKLVHKGSNLDDCFEAQILQKFESLPIVPLHELLCYEEWWFSVTEHHRYVYEVFHPHCPIREGVKFGHQLLHALASFHHHNIAHLDIALENILVTSDNTFLLIDFGQSCITDGVTPTTSVYGGRDNIAPEMATSERGKPYDPFRADIYACGILFISILNPLFEFTNQLLPLFGKMVAKVPEERILASDALEAYKRIVSQIPEDTMSEHRRFRFRQHVFPRRFDEGVGQAIMKWCQE